MNIEQSKILLKKILGDIESFDGSANLDDFQSLRAVDAKVRDVRTLISNIPSIPPTLVEDMKTDADFEANSRRVRLEALANYCRSALMYLDSGVYRPDKIVIHKAPDVSKLVGNIPSLDKIIERRWLEAQICRHKKCYLSSVILMGSILEALLLARASNDLTTAYTAKSSPKDKTGKPFAIQDWKLSSLIDVAAEVGWIKIDRAKFSHALRDSRNFVHPWQEASSKTEFDNDTCDTCWSVLNAATRDLLNS